MEFWLWERTKKEERKKRTKQVVVDKCNLFRMQKDKNLYEGKQKH